MKVWTYLEWRGHRAHYIADVRAGWIRVEFLDGSNAFWPLADCRRVGA